MFSSACPSHPYSYSPIFYTYTVDLFSPFISSVSLCPSSPLLFSTLQLSRSLSVLRLFTFLLAIRLAPAVALLCIGTLRARYTARARRARTFDLNGAQRPNLGDFAISILFSTDSSRREKRWNKVEYTHGAIRRNTIYTAERSTSFF